MDQSARQLRGAHPSKAPPVQRTLLRARSLLPMSSSAPKNNPSDFLKTVLGRPVVVKLNSGVDYRGMRAAIACIAPRYR